MTRAQRIALDVTLAPASEHDRPLLENLLQLYIHDLSAVFAVELNADGRFAYDKLPLYWSEAERRFPLLIRSGERVAGFVLVTIGSPFSDDPAVHDIAEFFILRRYRRSGVGGEAARQVWDRFRGGWIVRVLEENKGALRFWSATIDDYTQGQATETRRDGWRVFTFTSG